MCIKWQQCLYRLICFLYKRRFAIPEYQYECRNCDHSFSIIESIHADAQTKCTACNNDSLYRVIFAPINGSFNNEPTTVGQLAERNWKKMGSYERDKKTKDDKVQESVERRERQERRRRINNMTPEQKQKWIMEGD